MGLIVDKYLFIYNNNGKKLIEANNLSNIKIWNFHSKELLEKNELNERYLPLSYRIINIFYLMEKLWKKII